MYILIQESQIKFQVSLWQPPLCHDIPQEIKIFSKSRYLLETTHLETHCHHDIFIIMISYIKMQGLSKD